MPNPVVYLLMDEVGKLSLPKADVNQERDKEIWNKYVEALRKLVYQKEQIWKVKSMSDMPFYSKELANEDDPLLDIVIEEKNLRKQFEKEIASTFDREGLIDYGVNGKNGFLEFSGERDMSKGENEKLVEMAAKLGKSTRPDIELGVCGEQGGNPASVEFFHNVNISCAKNILFTIFLQIYPQPTIFPELRIL